MKLGMTVVTAAAALLFLSRETVEAVELDKRTPVTLYNFLDDGASRLEEAGSEAAHASVASLNAEPDLADTRLTLGQPGHEALQRAFSKPPLDLLGADAEQPHPARAVESSFSVPTVHERRPKAQHAVPAEQVRSLTSLAAKAQVGSTTSAFEPLRPRDRAPQASSPMTGFDVSQQSSSLASQQQLSSASAARDTGGPSHLSPPRDQPSSSREPKRRYTDEEKEHRNWRDRRKLLKLKADAAKGNIPAQEKLATFRGYRRVKERARQSLPMAKEKKNKARRLAYQKLKDDAAGPDEDIAREAKIQLEKKRQASRDSTARSKASRRSAQNYEGQRQSRGT